jgi:hypothetical protein
MILGTSLMRLGIAYENLPIKLKAFSPEKNVTYYWFRAGMMSTWENPICHLLAPCPLFHLGFSSKAYYLTLWYEYLVWCRSTR